MEQVAKDILQASVAFDSGLPHYKQAYLERVERINAFNARAKA